eukprot:6840171-Pyramimonas_sp.AAC.1
MPRSLFRATLHLSALRPSPHDLPRLICDVIRVILEKIVVGPRRLVPWSGPWPPCSIIEDLACPSRLLGDSS